MGIVAFMKSFAPVLLYSVGLLLALRALSGKTELTLWFLVALLPLRNIIDRFHGFPLGKDFVDIVVLTLLLGWGVSTMLRKEKFIEKTPINGLAVAFILYAFVSVLQGSSYLQLDSLFSISDLRVQSWKNFCILPTLFFITLNNIRTKENVWRTVVVMCVTMVFMDFYLTRQISWYSGIVSREKIEGTFVFLGPNEIAAFYTQYTILLIAVFFSLRKKVFKWLLLGLIWVNLFCITFLFSRAAYISLAVGMFFLFAVKKRILLVPLVLVAIFWQVALPDKVIERINMTTNEYGELDASAEHRLIAWQQAMDLFYESPVTGVGYGVFSQMGFRLGDTHNIYMKILAEQGLVGIFIFLLLVFAFFSQGIKLYLHGDDELSKGLGLGFAICIIVLMVNNIFGDRWTYMEVSSNLWVFAALVARLNIFSDEAKFKKQVQDNKRSVGTCSIGISKTPCEIPTRP
ncbi:MAG: O-antigen ligase family protein [Candidatus Omnitrophica bacterium]|nr:O-antigen ligase family protein [Candidatus Omnitrophota bacterium]